MNSSFKPECSKRACACSTGPAAWDRRSFLKTVGLGVGALAAEPWGVMAGPFTRADFQQLVPADKKLDPGWVRSLTARGSRTVYRGADLEKIGMPVGGICTGQLYLGGDGKLWHWDIFNQRIGTGSDHYAKPLAATSPLEQGFAIQAKTKGQTLVRTLDRKDWPGLSFTGEYPIGYVEYSDEHFPVRINLEAYSPFIPLNTSDSSLPVTVLDFTITNKSQEGIELEFAGWLENAVCLHSSRKREGFRRNRVVREPGFALLECSAEPAPKREPSSRPDIELENFEHETYGSWVTTGTAFGSGPVDLSKVPGYQGDLGGKGSRAVNSHASAPGATVEEKDSAVGTLTSPPFKLERDYLTFLIGGGAHAGKTCMNLVVDGARVLTATGSDNNRLRPTAWDVRPWAGKNAHLEIIDRETGPWGNIGVDEIVLSDHLPEPPGDLAAEQDFGTMGLALLGHDGGDFYATALPPAGLPAGLFSQSTPSVQPAKSPFSNQLIGCLGRKLKLKAGASRKVTFLVTWHMPNLKMDRLPPGRHYAACFDSALAISRYVADNFARLSTQTRLWHDTWYDSTLPFWFLDRTFLNTSILATSTCYRFKNGRFYAWEGVGCCEGTCGHVWQYAHAAARLFPELERTTREAIDFGLAMQPDGAIHFRGEFNDFPAIDAQAGTILRALREHQTSVDDSFLRRVWPKVKAATDWLIAKDANGDGLIESNQHNTLDTDWFGPVAWLSGLYLSALLAAQTMAAELGDTSYAEKCGSILKVGQQRLVAELFDGEYFINKPDPNHLEAINSGTGCEIDQVFGQSWAFQVGLPRVLPREQTVSALRSLWRYNFTPDVGPYRAAYKPGRWYAMPGEAGLLMCSFPRTDWDYSQAKGKGPDWAAGYFNECMNGFEYQAAGHMVWEGLVTEGLAVARAVHDRYHPSRRNPWNEVECGDHYARSMASYGVYLAACGFEYHGPQRHLGFVPRVFSPTAPSSPRAFKCAFTAAEGWGTFEQKVTTRKQTAELSVHWGQLKLRTLALALELGRPPSSVRVEHNNHLIPSDYSQAGNRLVIRLPAEAQLGVNHKLRATIA